MPWQVSGKACDAADIVLSSSRFMRGSWVSMFGGQTDEICWEDLCAAYHMSSCILEEPCHGQQLVHVGI